MFSNMFSTQDWLGISYASLSEILNGSPFYSIRFDDSVSATKQDAINMLKNLIETGDVVWEKKNEC